MIKRLIGWIAALATLFAVAAAALRCGEYRSMLSLRAEWTEASAGVPGGTFRSGEREPRRSRCGLRVLPLSRERFRACRCGSFSFPDRFREIKSPAMKLPLRHSLPQG